MQVFDFPPPRERSELFMLVLASLSRDPQASSINELAAQA